MGHRYHLYEVPKAFIEETAKCQTLAEFRNVYVQWCKDIKQFENENHYALYEIGKDLFCTEDCEFNSDMHLYGDTLFKSIELRERFQDYDVIVLDDKIGLEQTIEWIRALMLKCMKELMMKNSPDRWDDRSQLDRMKDYIQCRIQCWESEFLLDFRPYILDTDKERLCRHELYDFIIWDLVRVYKNFDWQNNSIILMGW